MIGLYFPTWMTEQGLPDSALSLVEGGAGLAVVFIAPWVGARSDATGTRVPALLITTAVAVVMTATLDLASPGFTLIGLGVALVAFNTGSVVYDALLPQVAPPDQIGRVSGLGVGIGYIGSFIGLGIGTLALEVWNLGFSPTFMLLAGGFALFAWPIFVFVHESPGRRETVPGVAEVITRLANAWRRARLIPGMVRFLVGRFLYSDAINTLIGGFLAIYAIEELGLTAGQTRNLLALAITAAIPGSLAAGRLVERLGALVVLRGVLVIWLAALGAGIMAGATQNLSLAWVIGALGGAALGATWTADRVVMINLSPKMELGEMYGLYATVGRFATILGPLIWALVVDGLGLGREWALGSLALFVATALVVLSGLKTVRSGLPTHM